jgi:hypothetical protein
VLLRRHIPRVTRKIINDSVIKCLFLFLTPQPCCELRQTVTLLAWDGESVRYHKAFRKRRRKCGQNASSFVGCSSCVSVQRLTGTTRRCLEQGAVYRHRLWQILRRDFRRAACCCINLSIGHTGLRHPYCSDKQGDAICTDTWNRTQLPR